MTLSPSSSISKPHHHRLVRQRGTTWSKAQLRTYEELAKSPKLHDYDPPPPFSSLWHCKSSILSDIESHLSSLPIERANICDDDPITFAPLQPLGATCRIEQCHRRQHLDVAISVPSHHTITSATSKNSNTTTISKTSSSTRTSTTNGFSSNTACTVVTQSQALSDELINMRL